MREEQKVDCQGMCVSETVELSVVDDHISQSRQSSATSEWWGLKGTFPAPAGPMTMTPNLLILTVVVGL